MTYYIYFSTTIKMTKNQKVCENKDPAYRPYDRKDSKKKKRNSHGKLNAFTWTTSEESLYVEFLKNNSQLFADIKERKRSKVFVQMSNFVKKRGPDQCRSHHQKMSIKHGSIDSIILMISEKKLNKAVNLSKQEDLVTEPILIEYNNEGEIETETQTEKKSFSEQENSQNLEYSMGSFQNQKLLWGCLNQDVWMNA